MLQLNDRLSEHFVAKEFAQRGKVLPTDAVTCTNLARLAVALEVARGEWAQRLLHLDYWGINRPKAAIHVACGYRDPVHNAEVGGASSSWHMRGLAADVACVPRWPALREGLGTTADAQLMQHFASFMEKFIDRQPEDHDLAFGGLGVYTEARTGQLYWLHVDLRPRSNGRVVRWVGHHTGSEQP